MREDAAAFDDVAAGRVPACGWQTEDEPVTDGEIAAAEHLTAGPCAHEPGEAVFGHERYGISPALRVCSLMSITTRPWYGFGPKPSVTRRMERSRWSTPNSTAICRDPVRRQMAHQPQRANEAAEIPS